MYIISSSLRTATPDLLNPLTDIGCFALFLLLKSLALASLLMDAYRLPLESILWWTGFCVLPQMLYATILVTWDALLVSPSKFLSLPLKVPPLVMGPAITPFTYTTVQTVHVHDVEPDAISRKFKRHKSGPRFPLFTVPSTLLLAQFWHQ